MNNHINKKVQFIDLGLKEYQAAWDHQIELFNNTLDIKSLNRNANPDDQKITPNYLLFVEHPHVYTLGKSGKKNHLLISEGLLKDIGATYYHTNRGGDITYHGPGQLVGYPILDLENFFTDIHKYMRLLEEVIIKTLSAFAISAGRIKGLTGVWVSPDEPSLSRKICAFGVKTSRWVTQHGFALNINPDLSYFNHIVPCGIEDRSVTSMEKELKETIDPELVKKILKKEFEEVFETALI